MALSFSRVGDLPFRVVGNRKRTVTDCTFDSSYLTGGEVWAASDFGLSRVEEVSVDLVTPGNATDTLANAKVVKSSDIAGTIMLYDAVPAEITSADNVSTTVVRVTAWGY